MRDALDITPAIAQRLAWDIVDCDEIDHMWGALDLIPPSEDVAEVAHAESHKRMSTVEPLAVMGELYITLAADIISKIMAKHYEQQNGHLPSAAEQAVMKVQNHEVIRGALWPVVAHLMETGMLRLGPSALQSGNKMRLI